MYWVYILQNPDGRFYLGHTDDLAQRLHRQMRFGRRFGRRLQKAVAHQWQAVVPLMGN